MIPPVGICLFGILFTSEKLWIQKGVAMSEEEKKSFCCRHKSRPDAEEKDLITRLNRIEGQIRGIRRMVENDAYCVDILTQVSAASCALNSFTKVLLSEHIKSCVTEDIRNGGEEKVDELVKVLQKLMK